MDSLKSLPKSLNDAYQKRLERAENMNFVLKVLNFIYHAKRPFEIGELLEAINVSPSHKTLDRNLMSPRGLLEHCEGLIHLEEIVIEEEVFSDDSSQSSFEASPQMERPHLTHQLSVVRFLHSTVRDFLKQKELCKVFTAKDMAEICLTYLNFDCLSEVEPPSRWSDAHRLRFDNPEKNKFLYYAAESWDFHLKGDGEMDERLQTCLWTLLASRRTRSYMCMEWTGNQTFVHIVARRGLNHVYESIMSTNVEDRRAYLKGKISKAEPKDLEMLLSEIEQIEAKDFARMTPLHYAVKHVEFIELLVSHGANINAADAYGETVLHKAAYSGDIKVVKCLVEHAAKCLKFNLKYMVINAQNMHGNTPLHSAASRNEFEVVKYLIGQGARINVSNRSGKTALDKARKFGETAKYLIEQGAVAGRPGAFMY
jgi:hypothetical protein